MAKKPADDSHLYRHLQNILRYHQTLVRDEARNKLFVKALKKAIKPGARVLDIGAGSGIWAVYAAKLGAERVTAIEADQALLPVIAAHARENGVADRVRLVYGNSRELNLPHKFDVIISETIGNQAFDEGIVGTLVDARKRFLAASGRLIPETVSLVAAPAHVGGESKTPSGVDLSTEYLRRLALNLEYKAPDRSDIQLLAEPLELLRVDLRTIEGEPNYTGLRAAWKLRNVARANSVILWAKSTLSDGVDLDTWETVNWTPIVCPIQPFTTKAGVLNFGLNMAAGQYHWSAFVEGEPQRAYTPMFAYTKIKMDMAFAPRRSGKRKRSG